MSTWADKILNGGWDTLSESERMDILRAVFNSPRAQAGERMVQNG